MSASIVDIQSATAEIRRGKKEERRNHRAKIQWPALLHRAAIKRKKKPQDENIMSASATQGGHKKGYACKIAIVQRVNK